MTVTLSVLSSKWSPVWQLQRLQPCVSVYVLYACRHVCVPR